MNNILVIGRERSGTKFLTNLIQLNFDLAAVQSAMHDGIIESNLVITYDGIFGKKPVGENKRALQILFKHEYFFKYANISEDEYELIDFETPIELLWKVLDAHAKNSHKLGWVQKVSARFPWRYNLVDAKRVIIQRNILDTTFSSMKLHKNPSNWFMLKNIISANFYRKVENHYSNLHTIPIVKYENFRDNTSSALFSLAEKVSIKLPNDIRLTDYNNSSFKNSKKSQPSNQLKFFDFIIDGVFRVIPASFCYFIARNYWKIKKPRKIVVRSLPPKKTLTHS